MSKISTQFQNRLSALRKW